MRQRSFREWIDHTDLSAYLNLLVHQYHRLGMVRTCGNILASKDQVIVNFRAEFHKSAGRCCADHGADVSSTVRSIHQRNVTPYMEG